MKPWQESLRKFIDERSELGHVVVGSLAEEFCLTHRSELAGDAEAHMLRRVSSEIRRYLRAGVFSTQEQMMFEGMDLPAFIAVRLPDSEETYYVRTGNATLADLRAGREERVNHVAAAQAKLQAYDESMDRLEPIMSQNPAMTVNEALAILRAQDRGNAS